MSASAGSTYPIQQQPGIWPPETPHVTYYTPPAGYPLATGYFYALQDIYNPAPADVYLDWMESTLSSTVRTSSSTATTMDQPPASSSHLG